MNGFILFKYFYGLTAYVLLCSRIHPMKAPLHCVLVNRNGPTQCDLSSTRKTEATPISFSRAPTHVTRGPPWSFYKSTRYYPVFKVWTYMIAHQYIKLDINTYSWKVSPSYFHILRGTICIIKLVLFTSLFYTILGSS